MMKDIRDYINKQKEQIDIEAAIAQVKGVDSLSEKDKQLVKTKCNIDGEDFYEYVVPGDQFGRTIITDRANTIVINTSFLPFSRTAYEGYFIDKDTGGVILEFKNTDDKDAENFLGMDDEIRFYRVRYFNPNTGETWYRWHYPVHIWGGYAYEERGHFEALDKPDSYVDNLGNTVNVTQRWVPESRLWIDEWSTAFTSVLFFQ